MTKELAHQILELSSSKSWDEVHLTARKNFLREQFFATEEDRQLYSRALDEAYKVLAPAQKAVPMASEWDKVEPIAGSSVMMGFIMESKFMQALKLNHNSSITHARLEPLLTKIAKQRSESIEGSYWLTSFILVALTCLGSFLAQPEDKEVMAGLVGLGLYGITTQTRGDFPLVNYFILPIPLLCPVILLIPEIFNNAWLGLFTLLAIGCLTAFLCALCFLLMPLLDLEELRWKLFLHCLLALFIFVFLSKFWLMAQLFLWVALSHCINENDELESSFWSAFFLPISLWALKLLFAKTSFFKFELDWRVIISHFSVPCLSLLILIGLTYFTERFVPRENKLVKFCLLVFVSLTLFTSNCTALIIQEMTHVFTS